MRSVRSLAQNCASIHEKPSSRAEGLLLMECLIYASIPSFSTNSQERTRMSDSNHLSHSILRRKQVQNRTGLSRSTIYERVRAGTFPRPISLGPRTVGWV